jgi:cytoskeletal protein CcmA (bactofilin family)
MFGNKSRSESAEPTVIGSGTVVEGSIRVGGPIQVDGQIDGALIAEGDAAIGRTGSVLGDVFADDLMIAGRVEGNVTVRDHLHVASGGSMLGEARYGSLQVDRGGVLAGSARTGEDSITIDADSGEAELLEDAAQAPSVLSGAVRA